MERSPEDIPGMIQGTEEIMYKGTNVQRYTRYDEQSSVASM